MDVAKIPESDMLHQNIQGLQVKSCASVSCLINTEPLELLHIQPIELIASESVLLYKVYDYHACTDLTY